MAGRYYVHIPRAWEVYGPYALKRAKDFARIGSQFGDERVVTRGLDGVVVRVYEDGERVWPVTERQLVDQGLTRGELPKKL